jgi:hypothetical protein
LRGSRSGSESNIYAAKVKNLYLITEPDYIVRDITDDCVSDFWFLVKVYNDGKSDTGRFVKAGYSVKHGFTGPVHDYIWESHFYLIHCDFEKYFCVWSREGTLPWNVAIVEKDGKEVPRICARPCGGFPVLGSKNARKLKIAVRQYLKSL